jgi:hypothetical protein
LYDWGAGIAGDEPRPGRSSQSRYTQSHRLIFVFSWNISIQNELTFSTAQNGSM